MVYVVTSLAQSVMKGKKHLIFTMSYDKETAFREHCSRMCCITCTFVPISNYFIPGRKWVRRSWTLPCPSFEYASGCRCRLFSSSPPSNRLLSWRHTMRFIHKMVLPHLSSSCSYYALYKGCRHDLLICSPPLPPLALSLCRETCA